jgi:hypothetical protein
MGEIMKVIIIEEDRFNDLTEKLRLHELDKRSDNTAERLGWPLNIWHEALNQARSEMHMEFVRWAQSHGASCLRK